MTAFTTNMVNTVQVEWSAGNSTYKCLYDDEHIYFAFEIPGEYRFSTEDNHLCAAVATMFKIGSKAEYVNMGNCPDAANGCPEDISVCDDYRVDIGAHWELSKTEQNIMYGVNPSAPAGNGTGNDLSEANKDDEYSVSSWCRNDDDDADAGNEWAGAWAHTNPVEGEPGVYHFELSRTLQTPSSFSDAQLAPGETYEFGVAFWDPFETPDAGWTDISHYVTGCASNWINLELSTGESITAEENGNTTAASSGVSFGVGALVSIVSSALAFYLAGM